MEVRSPPTGIVDYRARCERPTVVPPSSVMKARRVLIRLMMTVERLNHAMLRFAFVKQPAMMFHNDCAWRKRGRLFSLRRFRLLRAA
jgi:hypothetical protein